MGRETHWIRSELGEAPSSCREVVILDLRPDSPSRRWTAVELTESSHPMLYIPEGVPHGFQTLEDSTMVCYQVSEFYHPESARVVRWDDPSFGVPWPLPDPILSERDRGAADYQG